ncbi:MAG TPA: hypothetical protein VFU19_09280 [Iamia sp.]|nr:hypothetical protein [Iamia sp.]
MTPPFAGMEPAARRRLVGRSVAVNVAFSAVMMAIGRPMRAGGHDIVPFELAGDAATVDRIVEDWGDEGVRAARLQTRLDMAYLVSYGVATSAGCALVADAARAAGRPGLARLGDLLGWGTVVAAGCDAVENASLLAELDGARGRLPALARRCALVKFGLIGPAVGYALVGLVITERNRRRAG